MTEITDIQLDSSRPARGGLLRVARLAGLLFMLFCVGIFILTTVGFPSYAASHAEEFAPDQFTMVELDSVLGRVGLSYNAWLIFQWVSAILVAGFFCAVGFFLYFRKADDWFGLYLAVMFTYYGTFSATSSEVLAEIFPGFFEHMQGLNVMAWAMLFLLFYLFPDGHFVPRWTRWAALALVLFFVWDVLFFSGDEPPPLLIGLMMSLIGVGLGSQVYRYRRISNALERQQTKWVMFALLIFFGSLMGFIVVRVLPGAGDPESPAALIWLVVITLGSLLILLIPLAIAVAVLRYRLWDVDVLIRRTLIYAAVTATLAVIFFGSVTLLQMSFSSISGQNSPVATVISTLLIAALFTPLRRRIQNDIDRRFFRKKYNAQKTLESFAASLRNEVELDELSAHLLQVVAETMQPEHVTLWMMPKQVLRRQTDDG